MKFLVSIIIPVYKAEKYLRECVDSVINQTYTELEIILVDDGSPDECPVICDEYASCDSRIKVIHKINGGASSARNCGIEAATGKFICFVDSDDRLPQNSVQDLVSSIVSNGTDYAAGICAVKETGTFKNNINTASVIDFSKNSVDLLLYITKGGSYSPYAKIYLTELIKENDVRFDESLMCSEDALFIRTYLRYCRRMSLVPSVVYEYTSANESSLSKKGYTEFCTYYAEKLKALAELCNTLVIEDHIKERFIFERAIHGLHISIAHYMNHWASDDDRKRLVKKSVETFLPWIDKYNGSAIELNTIDKATVKWWSEIGDYVCDQSFDKFYSIQWRYHSQRSIKSRVKRILKRLVRNK